MLIPLVQSKIDAQFKELNLSAERQSILQPLIEAKIQISKRDSDDDNYGYDVDIVDAAGKKRENIKVADLVSEINKATDNKEIPKVKNKNLTEKQMKLIAEGKLGIIEDVEKVDANAVPASEILERLPSLEDVSSGKVKVDLNA